MAKLTPLSKGLIAAAIAAGGFFGIYKSGLIDKIALKGKGEQTQESIAEDGEKIIKVGVVTWGGYAGGEYYNEGFKANKNSQKLTLLQRL